MKRTIAALLLIAVLALAAPALAENAPMATTPMDGGPLLMSFKVWVLPHSVNGIINSGYYEHFDMLVYLRDGFQALDAVPFQPVVPPIPAAPSSGR